MLPPSAVAEACDIARRDGFWRGFPWGVAAGIGVGVVVTIAFFVGGVR